MKLVLKILFGSILVFMIGMTTLTTLREPLFLSGHINPAVEQQFASSPWAVATLYDAYFGFITFFCWVAYKERSNWVRLVWFVAIMALGNIAMSAYVLVQLFRLRTDEDVADLFARRS